MGISTGQVSWWKNHKDVGWRGCLKACWPASCSDKNYCNHSLESALALSNSILRISQKEDSQHFCVTVPVPHYHPSEKYFYVISNLSFSSQNLQPLCLAIYIYIICHCKELFHFISFCSFSSRCHRLLLDHNLAPTSPDETSPDPSAYARRSCIQVPWAFWWSSFQFLIIPFDLESPEWDESFQAGPHMHQLRRKATSLDLLTMFFMMMLILFKLRAENIYTALESPTGFVQHYF